MKSHQYEVSLAWTGNQGQGTTHYRSYERSHVISASGRPAIEGSSDPSFRGDRTKYSPEELLVASVSACHMLWYLHLCANSGIVVVDYQDSAKGVMMETPDGSGRFEEITLHPKVIVADERMMDQANSLHEDAHKMCFMANSVNFRITHRPTSAVQ